MADTGRPRPNIQPRLNTISGPLWLVSQFDGSAARPVQLDDQLVRRVANEKTSLEIVAKHQRRHQNGEACGVRHCLTSFRTDTDDCVSADAMGRLSGGRIPPVAASRAPLTTGAIANGVSAVMK